MFPKRAAGIGNEVPDRPNEYLLAAAHAPSSPPRACFRPNMLLAKELLDKGEREAVPHCLDLCGAFWETGQDRLQQWKVTIEGGGTRESRAELVYGLQSMDSTGCWAVLSRTHVLYASLVWFLLGRA